MTKRRPPAASEPRADQPSVAGARRWSSRLRTIPLALQRRTRLLLLAVLALLARPFVRRRAADAPQKILYVKPDHLGDLLLATPALAALRRQFPEARITALVGPWSRAVLERNPDVDALLVCPFPGFNRAAPGSGLAFRLAPWLRLLHYGALLRAGSYDLALIGRDDHWWGAALALLAGIPRRIGFAVPECRPLLTDALPWHPRDHVTAQGLALVAQAASEATSNKRDTGGSAPAPSPQPGAPPVARFDPAPADLAWAATWRAENCPAGERLVVIHPGTGGPAKHWAAERWSAVGDALAEGGGVRLALTGGPGEERLVEEVAVGMRTRPLILAGRTSVGQLAALMRLADLVLGVDSGPLHLAAAQGAPTVHLYGPGDDQRFGPWGDSQRHRVLRAELPCSPCGVFDACPRGLAFPECMDLIRTEQVASAAREMLHAKMQRRADTELL
ncbi:MAG TPA: glycosyltransferase family 9 protein [Roseiflexaceae bacterium]|nr:glycosyltransferase family 9 protein [Roseiflexaceae bacterium]